MPDLSIPAASPPPNLTIEHVSAILVGKQELIYKSDSGENNMCLMIVLVLFVLGCGNTILHYYGDALAKKHIIMRCKGLSSLRRP